MPLKGNGEQSAVKKIPGLMPPARVQIPRMGGILRRSNGFGNVRELLGRAYILKLEGVPWTAHRMVRRGMTN